MDTEVQDFLEKTIKSFLAAWSSQVEVKVIFEEVVILTQIKTDQDKIFIQPTAQPLLALQHLIRLAFKKQFPDHLKKLLIDIGSFRDQQLTEINRVAKEAIWQAKASGNAVHLSPMSSFERRLIHMQIVAEPDLTSESIGMGEHRHVVIKLNTK